VEKRKQSISVAALSLVEMSKKRLASGPVGGQMLHRPANNSRKKNPRGNFVDEKCFASRHLVSPPWQPEKKGKEMIIYLTGGRLWALIYLFLYRRHYRPGIFFFFIFFGSSTLLRPR
jgi:hypothetical protein